MKIGLVRHFKIAASTKKTFMNSQEFAGWVADYERSGVTAPEMVEDLSHWPKCICSSSTRTLETACLLYQGDPGIEQTNLIKEVPIAPVFRTSWRLPLKFWLISGRIAWLLSHKSQPESLADTKKRVKIFIKELLLTNNSDVLVVSHGFIMRLISQELLKVGFQGVKFTKAINGQLYLFQQK